jgi:hypothetical protein
MKMATDSATSVESVKSGTKALDVSKKDGSSKIYSDGAPKGDGHCGFQGDSDKKK